MILQQNFIIYHQNPVTLAIFESIRIQGFSVEYKLIFYIWLNFCLNTFHFSSFSVPSFFGRVYFLGCLNANFLIPWMLTSVPTWFLLNSCLWLVLPTCSKRVHLLILSTDPQSRPVVIFIFTQIVRPSTFFKMQKLQKNK